MTHATTAAATAAASSLAPPMTPPAAMPPQRAQPIDAYRASRRTAETPRTTERRLFAQITAELEQIDPAAPAVTRIDALHRNREYWSALAADCAAPGNALPAPLRAGIISLALFVGRHSSAVMAGTGDVADLIAINRMMIDGLADATAGATPS